MKNQFRFCMIGNFLSPHGVTPQICETLSDSFENSGHAVYRGGRRLNRLLRMLDILFVLGQRRKQVQFALIDTFSGSAFWWALLAGVLCRVLRLPYIPILHGGNLPTYSVRHEKRVSWYLRNARKIVAPSPYLHKWATDLHKRAARLNASSEVIPNPIVLSNYSRFRRTDFSLHLLWIRRFHEIYNPLMALRVLHILSQKSSDVRLTMVGPDAGALDACRRLAPSLKIDGRVQFKGFLTKPEMNRIAREHDIFLNTSNIDNTPFTLVEAAALGLPIVSTRAGGIPDSWKDGVEALLVEPDNSEQMADAVLRIHSQPALGIQLAANAYEKIKAFDWIEVEKKWEKAFEEVAGKSPSPPLLENKAGAI